MPADPFGPLCWCGARGCPKAEHAAQPTPVPRFLRKGLKRKRRR